MARRWLAGMRRGGGLVDGGDEGGEAGGGAEVEGFVDGVCGKGVYLDG